MLFVTNRFPKGSIRTRLGRKFEFDLKNNAPSYSVFYCKRGEDGSSIEIGGMDFMSELKRSPYRQILLYVHGYSNLPEGIFEAAQELQQLCDKKKAREALVVPVIWPCDNDYGAVKDYWDDQQSADASDKSFSRALNHFLKWRESDLNEPETDPCTKRINILAHSMGNRVLRETLYAWFKYSLPGGIPLVFRNSFLVAADIENESIHRKERASIISDASRNVVVYFAADDLALRASKVVNLRNRIASRRLGHGGPENMELTPHNVYAVDCDDVNNSYDPGSGHTYFRSGKIKGDPGLVFDHIFECMVTGRVFPNDDKRRLKIIQPQS